MRANTLHVTTDAWSSINSYPLGGADNMDHIYAPFSTDETQMITGVRTLAIGQQQHIYTLDGDAGVPVGKSGSDIAGGVNSIPIAAGGITGNGIGVVA